jgi:aspartyl-tRNA(Asn)/glutamyl-tRNA(Gln) amidotransferase subunit A
LVIAREYSFSLTSESEMEQTRPGTIDAISNELDRGKLSSSSLTEECLKRILEFNPKMRLFITITEDRARTRAKESDNRIADSKKLGRLDGVPVAIKDNFFIKGIRCTAGSKILSDYVPEYTAPAVERLEDAGAVIVGTTNLHEFASGATNINPFYGTTLNPWDLERITGGSSGGSAAAVALGLAFAALGTDTSGSVRIPASLCGVIGLKPTFGLISTRGTIPLSTSLDHVGILTRFCLDAAIVLDLLAGYDELDPNSVRAPRSPHYFEEAKKAQDTHHKIGIPRKYFLDFLSDEVRACFDKTVLELRSLGFEIGEVDIPNIEHSNAIWSAIRFSEAAAFHQRWFESRPNDYGEDVRWKLERGKEFSAIQYILARKESSEFRKTMTEAFGQFDALVTPTTPIEAPKINEPNVSLGSSQTDVYTALVRQTQPFNVTGLPAVSVPMGFSRDGLPLGLQIVGRAFEEATIMGIGSAYERKFRKIAFPTLALA